MKTRSTLGEVATSTLLLIVLAGVVVGWVAPKPKFLDKRSREADKSADASAQVEKAVAKAVEAEQAKGAVVAASVQQIGVAAGQLPESPQKTFIVREGGFISPLLPPPDPAALLAAERRRVAILEGKLELVDKLYARAAADSAKLLERAVKAEAKVTKQFAERREVDGQLAESAAYQRGQNAVIGFLVGIAVLCVAGWIYARVTGFGRADIARMANRVREGMSPLDAIDATVPDWMHDSIAKTAAKLRAKEAARVAAAQAAAKS